MEQCNTKSLRSTSSRSKNGFSIRNKLKKNESKWMSSLPFSLVAKNKNLSKSLYGLTEPITKISYDAPFIDLKNTAYVSFDYESYCNTDIDISKLTKFKKSSIIPTRNRSNSEALYSKQSPMEFAINLKRIQLTDLLKFKLSQGSRSYVESFLSKVESNKNTETIRKVNTTSRISILSNKKHYSNNVIYQSNSKTQTYKIANEAINTTNNLTASHPNTSTKKIENKETNESGTQEDIIYAKKPPDRSTSTQNHDSLINDFELRGEIDNSNNKIINKDVLVTISNFNSNYECSKNLELNLNETRKLKRSFSKQQLTTNKRFRPIVTCEHASEDLEISSNTSNIGSNQPVNQVIPEHKTSSIKYKEFVSKHKKIQYETKLFGKNNSARNNNASNTSNRFISSNNIEVIDLTI